MRRTATLTLCLLATATLATPASAAYVATVIATGLDSPRGLAFGPDGGLYIAESGTLAPSGPETVIRNATYRYGETGAITRYENGVQERIATGLPSLVAVGSREATGPQDIAFDDEGNGYVVVGLGANPAVRATDLGPDGVGLGQIYAFTNAGVTGAVADVAAFELGNPGGGPLDSNPFHLAVTGDDLLVTDAGGNSLLRVADDGTVTLVATFPGRNIGGGFPSDSVPTGVAVGPDGSYYVAELTGFPFTDGAAQIYRFTPDPLAPGGVTLTTTIGGFTNITDIAFGDDGSLYVLELDADGLRGPGTNGALIRVAADGTQEVLFSDGLVAPTGLAIGADGAFYVTNFSTRLSGGEVLRIAQVSEPAALALLGMGVLGLAARRRRRAG